MVSEGLYNVQEGEIRKDKNEGWCGTRFLIIIVIFSCSIIYLIGSIMTGIAYYHYNYRANCTTEEWFDPTETYVYQTPLVVVGPCFMSAGGSVLVMFLLQWLFCRPYITH